MELKEKIKDYIEYLESQSNSVSQQAEDPDASQRMVDYYTGKAVAYGDAISAAKVLLMGGEIV